MTQSDAAFDRLYEQHHRPILAYCLRRAPREDAHEAANQVFTVAWRRAGDVPGGESTLPWLYGVARKVLSDQRRSAARFVRLAKKAAGVTQPAPPGADTVVVQRQEYEVVLAAVQRLREDDREMLLLSAWEGLTHAEIAEAMGYTLATVDKRLARAKERLRRQYVATQHRPPTSTAKGGDGA